MKKQDILENQANTAYLSIGSNLGNRIVNIEKAKYLLNYLEINILKTSNFYKTKSWPDENFPYYLNIILSVNTKLNLINLYNKVKYVEKLLGRIKSKRNSPRICDIDIIDFNSSCLSKKNYLNDNITVPHSRMHKRNFVLLPLFELNKKWIHPKFKKNIITLISSLSIKDLRSIKLT